MKYFKTGDHVTITAGKKIGVTGMVLRVDQQIVYAKPNPSRTERSASCVPTVDGGTEGCWRNALGVTGTIERGERWTARFRYITSDVHREEIGVRTSRDPTKL